MRLILAAMFAGCATSAIAGAWTIQRGETRTYVTSSFTYGDHGFDENGDLVAVPEYRKLNLSAALEYGMRPWLTAIVRGEMTDEELNTEVGPDVFEPESKTFASVAGGARVRLYQGPMWVASAEVIAFSGGFTTAGDGKPNDSPGVEIRALGGIGGDIYDIPVFADAQLAYRAEFQKDQSDEIKLDLTLGAQVMPNWMLLAQTYSTFQTDGESSYHKLSGSVVRRVTDRLRVEVGGTATVAGKNAIRELGAHIGFWWVLPPEKSTRDMPDPEVAALTEEQIRLQSIFK